MKVFFNNKKNKIEFQLFNFVAQISLKSKQDKQLV